MCELSLKFFRVYLLFRLPVLVLLIFGFCSVGCLLILRILLKISLKEGVFYQTPRVIQSLAISIITNMLILAFIGIVMTTANTIDGQVLEEKISLNIYDAER